MMRRTVVAGVVVAVAAGVYGSGRAADAPAVAGGRGGDFPFKIAFERGTSTFAPGDSIEATEVVGTSADMTSGICRIAGTYTLASQEAATLAASVTAEGGEERGWAVECGADGEDGEGAWDVCAVFASKRGGLAAREFLREVE